MINKIGLKIITMFGVGKIKKAPGTAASFVTTVIYFLLFISEIPISVIFLIFFILLIFSINLIDKNLGNFSKNDPKEIVIDEFLGQSIPCILICFKLKAYNMFGYQASSPIMDSVIPFFIAFATFRIFDIFKPYPINVVDKKIHNGFGIIFDDILAGIYSAITTYLILYIIY
tara:strand:+ start:2222 stop:2737 length:516 start_codon:yes stop_codon:yes gene_type:complete